MELEFSTLDSELNFKNDFRLEGALDGGIDHKDFALRQGKVIEASGEKCLKCGHPFVSGDYVRFLIFGYEPASYRKVFFCYGCLPRFYQRYRNLCDEKCKRCDDLQCTKIDLSKVIAEISVCEGRAEQGDST